jgi:hypothetical protein
MKKQAILLWTVLFAIGFTLCADTRTIIVKKDGSGDAVTIQAAFNAAANGDIIEIGDDEKYIEDVTVSPALAQAGIPASPIASFTLRAASGKHPVIQAANAVTSQRMIALGLPGQDYLGFVVWGCKGVMIQGIEIVNYENTVNAFNVQSSLVIADSADVTIENCTIRGPAARSPGEGNGILIAGVQANPFRTDNIVVRNCLITETHYGVISAVFQKGSGADPNHVTVEDCRFIDGYESGVDIDNAGEAIVRRCTFNNYNHGIHFAGGNAIVEDCLIMNTKQEGLDLQVDTNWNDHIAGVVVRRCAVIGCGFDSDRAGIRCADGSSRFENCISAGNAGPGILVTCGSNSDVNAVFDHCDIYENFGDFEVKLVSTGNYLGQLTITNSNIVSTGSGILNEVELEAVIAHHNNVFVKFDAYERVNATASLSLNPKYVSPAFNASDFTFAGFQLREDSPVLRAGEGGAAIGSQGLPVTTVKSWRAY